MPKRPASAISKFARIEVSLRDALLGLGKADKEITLVLGGKYTIREKKALSGLQERCQVISKDLKKEWENLFDIADGADSSTQ